MRVTRWSRWSRIGVVALALSCASGPSELPLDAVQVRTIERGVTTRDEIERWFGAPTDFEESDSGASMWRYERRWRELARPGAARRVVCSSVGWLPVVGWPLIWLESCTYIERREELELHFTPERVVAEVAFDEERVPVERVERVAYPYPYPCRYPCRYPYPPYPRDPIADATDR
jgi:hypothetical protein